MTFLLVLDIIVASIITILVLLQRSEGGLGGLTGQSSSSFLTARQTGNMLSTLTMVFFALFVVISLALVVLSRHSTEVAPPNLLPTTETPAE
ncbi:MAG: preprotein translocase subunit SecG [Alphaproteobacteria bacterium]|nr:preprotein translocase subunit SecG [Alphaproteobacteria bacterium]